MTYTQNVLTVVRLSGNVIKEFQEVRGNLTAMVRRDKLHVHILHICIDHQYRATFVINREKRKTCHYYGLYSAHGLHGKRRQNS